MKKQSPKIKKMFSLQAYLTNTAIRKANKLTDRQLKRQAKAEVKPAVEEVVGEVVEQDLTGHDHQ
jgi:hypothetical protein